MMDIDFIWHQWFDRKDRIGERTVNHFMLIEEKSRGADLAMHQRDSMWMLHQCMEFCDSQRLKVKTVRGDIVAVKWWGYHKLRYSGQTPDQSDWIEWDKTQVTIDELLAILRYELHPIELTPLDDDRRHHANRQMELPYAEL